MQPHEFININMGRLSREQASNVARELRYLWRYLETVYPQGDKKQAPQLKVTLDHSGSYHFYLNHQALKLILFYTKDIPGPLNLARTAKPECPPEVPDFLRWDKPSDSTPE